MTKAHADEGQRQPRPGLKRNERLPLGASSRPPRGVRHGASRLPQTTRGSPPAPRPTPPADPCRPLPGARPGRASSDPGLRGVPSARHRCPSGPLLTGGPRRRPHTRRTAGAALAVPGCSARPCGAAASRMAARRRRGLRARGRARGRGTGWRGLMGSEFGVPRPSARPNQVADRRAPLCRELAGVSSGPPRLRK